MELQRLHAGDPDVDFWCAGQLSPDMRAAVVALLHPQVHGSIRPIYLRAKVVELVCLAFEHVRRTLPASAVQLRLTTRDLKCLEEVRRLLKDCVSAPSLEQLARRVGINRSKLALGFKQMFGITVGQYHRERRLELARDMLEKHTTSIGRVAAAAGYADAGSFSKAFRARFGFLPSELRSASMDSELVGWKK